MFVATNIGRDKTFVICLILETFVATNIILSLLRQAYFCREKRRALWQLPQMIVDGYVVCWTVLAARFRLTQSKLCPQVWMPKLLLFVSEVEYSIIRSAES